MWPFEPHIITRGFNFFDPQTYAFGFHNAIDLISDDPAKKELAVKDGTWHPNPFLDSYGGWCGWIDDDKGFRWGYYHGREPSPVADGTRVSAGDFVLTMGETGLALGNHLHLYCWHRSPMDLTARPTFNGWWAHNPELYLEGDEVKEILRVIPVHGGYTFVLTGEGELRYIQSENEREYLLAHGYTIRDENDSRVTSMLDSENHKSLQENLDIGRYG